MRIVVGGKGGTGKTVISGLVIRSLIEGTRDGPILCVDADPDANLGETLGMVPGTSLGDVREDLLERQRSMPPTVDKRIWLESKIFEIMEEGDRFDLLTMGRPEGPGCYCAVNNILRNLLDSLSSKYEYVVVDAEAGLEHLSRRTTGSVDEMIAVTDLSMKGFRTARRMIDLAEGLGTRIGRFHLVANRVANGEEALNSMAASVGLEIELMVPEDRTITMADMEGRSVFTLDSDSKALGRVSGFVKKELLKGG